MKSLKTYTLLLLLFSAFSFSQIGYQENIVIDNTYGIRNPENIFAEDMDGDGYKDIIATNYNKAIWFKNIDGNGNFSETGKIIYNTNDFVDIQIVDIDNDSDLDLVFINLTDYKIYWCRNDNGLGDFSLPLLLNSTEVYDIDSSDFDNDNDIDLIVVTKGNASVLSSTKKLSNDGTGLFSISSLTADVMLLSHIIDVTGDGIKDLIYINSTTTSLVAKKQNADGTLTLLETMDGSPLSQLLTSGDIDGDGDKDIVSVYQNGAANRKIKWYQNTNGLGTFANNQVLISLSPLSLSSSDDILSIVVTDLNNDNKVDILLNDSNLNRVSWYKNLGLNTFGPEQIITSNNLNVRQTISKDINSDNTNDIISVSYTDSKVAWYKNINNLSFSTENIIASQTFSPSIVEMNDIDKDGDKDIVTLGNTISWHENLDGNGNFGLSKIICDYNFLNSGSIYNMNLNDYDNDGDDDLSFSHYIDGSTTDTTKIYWYENIDGHGNFANLHLINTTNDVNYPFISIDIDNDNDIDIIEKKDFNFIIYKNNGTGTFVSEQMFSTNLTVQFGKFIFNDFDADNDNDLMISYTNNTIYWYENTTGQGQMSNPHLITTSPSSISKTYITDLDSDNLKDIITIESNSIYWYKNINNTGTFEPKVQLAPPASGQYILGSIIFEDIDFDEDIDIVYNSSVGFKVGLFKNNGVEIFSTPTALITPSTNTGHAHSFKDVNADGKNDLIYTSGDKLSWYKNLGLFSNKITGTIQLDSDANGCNSSDVKMSQILVTTQNGSNTFSTFSQTDGTFNLSAGEGQYVTSITSPLVNYNVNPLSYTENFIGLNSVSSANFCVEPSIIYNDLEIDISPINQPRPGFPAKYSISVKNKGTNPLSGFITFTYNNGKLIFVNATQLPSSQTLNTLNFDFNNLLAFQSKTINVTFTVKNIPDVNLGENIVCTAEITGAFSDTTPTNNTFNLNQIVIGAYDPNDITVLEGSEILLSDADDYLHYVIRFQNTGSYFAERVNIKNILDPKLDWNTLEIISSSHNNRVEIKNGNQIDFIFDAIYLPSATQNLPESNGYISYKIKPKSNVVIGDIFNNQANIYFDNNPAITTNNVSTEIVTVLGIEDFSSSDVVIYPIPTNNELIIKSNINLSKVEIYNELAQLIYQSNKTDSIDFSKFNNGFYILKITDIFGKNITKKVIKN